MAKRGFIKYKAYLFIDKDPIIDAVRTVRQDCKASYQQIRDAGGPAVATLRNWEHGKTRRPQFATVAAATRAMGMTTISLTKNGPRIR